MIAAISFLTVVGRGRPPDAGTFRWFPVVGAAIGGVLGLAWWGLAEVFPPGVAAVIVVALDLGITGMLHADGLADSADGLLPHMDRSQRLEVMRRPDLGAFGAAVLATVLLARWASLAADRFPPVALVAVWALGRTLAAVVPAVVPYARASGLASPFVAGSSRWLGLWAVPAVALLVVADGAGGLAGAVGALAAGAAIVALALVRIGGFTGDVLGAVIVGSETVALVAMTAGR